MPIPNFETMSVGEAVEYCYKHKNKFIAEAFSSGDDGVEQFDCLIYILEQGTIKPTQLPEYGMDYEY